MIEKKTLSTRICYAVILLVVAICALSCLLPLLYTLAVSLSSKSAVAAGRVAFVPVDFTLENYMEILQDALFFNSFLISVERVVLATVLSLTVLIMAAYPLAKSKKQFPVRNIVLWMCIFCMMFSGGLIPWYMVMKKYGLINNIFGLAISGGLPIFNLILFVNFFQSISKELEEAAIVDGAGPWKILSGIIVPVSKPIIATVALFTIVAQWNEFFHGYILSTNLSHYPLQSYIKQMVVQIDYSTITEDQLKNLENLSNKAWNSAKIFISMIPVLVIYPFLQKYFVSGIMLGSVKE